MGIFYIRFGKFSSIILLKIFAGPLSWKYSFSSIPIILKFGLLIVSWISWMFWVRSFCFWGFLWLLCQCFLWYFLPLRFSLLSLIFCWWCLHLWLLISLLGFLSPELSSFVISLLFLLPFLDHGWFCSIPSPVSLCFPVIL